MSERTWTCQGCGTVHDRDVNAARSVLGEALRIASLNEFPQVAGREGTLPPFRGQFFPQPDRLAAGELVEAQNAALACCLCPRRWAC